MDRRPGFGAELRHGAAMAVWAGLRASACVPVAEARSWTRRSLRCLHGCGAALPKETREHTAVGAALWAPPLGAHKTVT